MAGRECHHCKQWCIMFSRGVCYAFVRPKRSYLEVVLFLGRAVTAPQVRRAEATSKTKVANILKITHRDEVEPPITDWLREAYELPDVLAARASIGRHRRRSKPAAARAARQSRAKGRRSRR